MTQSNDVDHKGFTKKVSMIGRRSFLKWGAMVIGGLVLLALGLWPKKSKRPKVFPPVVEKSKSNRKKLIFVAIDGLHPNYLELDAKGLLPGTDGNWLMPNLRAFLKKSMWYKKAKAFLPAATDMNHLNTLAGTSSAQTGIIGVWAQPTGWDANGKAIIQHSSMSFARDDRGRPVDTLFHAWKRRWPDSKTLLITGKEWVGEMFLGDKTRQVVSMTVTGTNYPEYLEAPKRQSFARPETDPDKACQPVSGHLGFFDGPLGLSDIMTRRYTGQGGSLTQFMEKRSGHFPHDRWIVDSALEIFKREDPDMAYILLAQCDDGGHCIGSAWDPSEFKNITPAYEAPQGCQNKPEYQLASSRNKLLFKEAALNVIRDVDIQFGRLMEGLEEQRLTEQTSIILLSDHSSVNHIYSQDFSSTDVMGLLEKAGLVEKKNIYAFSVSSYGALYWRDHKETIPKARALLEAHRTLNHQTGQTECPWWVLDRHDMKNGIEGVCLPGELYHNYYIDVDREKSMMWPDLIILGKNGWQIPVYNGQVPNVGYKVPTWAPPWRIYNGGHGSIDTLPIVAAISVPGRRTGIKESAIRISELGVTAASLFGLKINSTTIGADLSKDLL